MSRVSVLFHPILTEDAVGLWSVGPCAGELRFPGPCILD